MKILILGASGILGRDICKILKDNQISFMGSYYSNIINEDNYFKFDLEKLDEIIEDYKPTIIINCIVNRNVDDCENKWNEIRKINIDLIEKLLTYQIKLIHISTDYVFDGNNAPYKPNSLTNPINNYGISKLIAELRIINKTNNYIIIRVPVLFTNDYKNLNETSVTMIGKKLMDLTLNNITEDAISIRRPVYIPLLSKFIYDCILNNYSGLYHFYNPNDKLTKYDIIKKIAEIINKPYDKIKPLYLLSDNRPFDTNLLDDKYDINNYFKNTNLEEQLKLCFNKFYHHSNFKDCFLMINLEGTLINSNEIKMMDGAENFIKFLNTANINYVIIADINEIKVDFYKEQLSILKTINNWIVKDDFNIGNFYKGETYIIGIESSNEGYERLKKITDIIYINVQNISNKILFKNKDVFLFNNFNQLYF